MTAAKKTELTTVALVAAIREGLPPSHEWDERERALLDLAARQAADIDRLEADIAEHGVRFENGRLNTAFCEARQARVALARLLGLIDIPESVSPLGVDTRHVVEHSVTAVWSSPYSRVRVSSSASLTTA